MSHMIWQFYLNYPRISFSSLHKLIEKSSKSLNASCIPNVLHTHMRNPDWFACFIHSLEKVKNILVENKLEWRKRTTNYLYPKSVYVPIKIGKEDVGVNQNVIMWIVSGTLKIISLSCHHHGTSLNWSLMKSDDLARIYLWGTYHDSNLMTDTSFDRVRIEF